MEDELLSRKDVAQKLKRSTKYVDQMVRRGFVMVAGRTTMRAVIVWLSKNPQPFRRK